MHSQSIQAAFADKVRRGIFNPVARLISFAVEDRLADAIGQTWALYQRTAEAGHVLDDALLVHHCKLRAIDLGRSVVPSGRRWRCQDVMDPRAYRNGKVEVLALDDVGLAMEASHAPERKMMSAIDLQTWVDELDERDQAIVACKLRGLSTTEASAEVAMSISGCLQREKTLGRALAKRAGLPTGEKPPQIRRRRAHA